ncbi:MAG: hypothetical protein IPO32_19780 [Crocinitomicaceae bacterium]|nr:hypothetical protein [Crocinitomicaceae bacterium]
MGWINCDYFYSSGDPLTSLTADLEAQYTVSNTAVYLHFTSMNSVASLYYDGSNFSSTSIPENMQLNCCLYIRNKRKLLLGFGSSNGNSKSGSTNYNDYYNTCRF